MLNVNSPCTVYIKFTGEQPKLFKLFNSKHGLYHFRYLNGKTPRIKFNIPDEGIYKGNVPFDVLKIVPIEIPDMYPELPSPERDRWKDVSMSYNPNLYDTPVRIFTETGLIETGPKYYEYPAPIRLFLLLHEQGHLFYKTEEYCDMWALVNYLRMGYNRSMAYYALSNILKNTPHNMYRLKCAFENIQKTQTEKL